MTNHRFNVIIIGAGPAGVAAAGALAGTGISVALLEAGVYAGAGELVRLRLFYREPCGC